MTRTHRLAHRIIWPGLAAVVSIALVAALVLRPPPETPAPPLETPVAAPQGGPR